MLERARARARVGSFEFETAASRCPIFLLPFLAFVPDDTGDTRLVARHGLLTNNPARAIASVRASSSAMNHLRCGKFALNVNHVKFDAGDSE